VGVMVLTEQFVALIYEKGFFNASDTAITAEALRSYAVGMVFAAVGEVLTKAFFAVEKTRLPMISSVISMGFNIAVIAVFGEKLGIGGIALVSALASGVNMTVNWIFAVRRNLITPDRTDAADLTKSILSALLMGAAVSAAAHLPIIADAGRILSFAIPTLVGIAVYAIAAALLRSQEMLSLIRVFTSKLNRSH